MKKNLIADNLSIVTTVIFLLIIFFPMINGIFHFSGESERFRGNRGKHETVKPDFNLNSIFPYFGKYESYYNNNFVFREFLIRNFNNLKFNLFHMSPVGSVLIGKKGWLFLAEESGINLLEYYFYLKKIKKEDLVIRKRWLLERKKWVESKGCKYYYVVVPNKQSVYPELMPEGLDKPPVNSMLDRTLRYFKEAEIDFIIDVRGIFNVKKDKRVLYQKTDTHWNQFGAFVAYKFVVESMNEFTEFNLKPVGSDSFQITENIRTGGDLLRMMSVGEDVFVNNMIELEKKGNGSCDPKLPSMLLIHDSFGEYFKKFIPSDFKKYFYTTDRNLELSADLIKKNKIKIIIEEIVERNFLNKYY